MGKIASSNKARLKSVISSPNVSFLSTTIKDIEMSFHQFHSEGRLTTAVVRVHNLGHLGVQKP